MAIPYYHNYIVPAGTTVTWVVEKAGYVTQTGVWSNIIKDTKAQVVLPVAWDLKWVAEPYERAIDAGLITEEVTAIQDNGPVKNVTPIS